VRACRIPEDDRETQSVRSVSGGWPLWTGAMPRPCFFPLFTNDLEEVYSEGRAPNSPRGNLLLGEDGRARRTLH
jgi:hypothetical protein